MPDKVFAPFHRTMDDVLIALASLAVALVIAGYQRFARVGVAALGIGLAYTSWSEYRNVELLQNWTYSALRPRLPYLVLGSRQFSSGSWFRSQPSLQPAKPHCLRHR
jgi:hypothetical protein